MRKQTVSILLALLLCLLGACALATAADPGRQAAEAAVPADAAYIGQEREDGGIEYQFRSESARENYEILVDASGAVARRETKRWDDRGGLSAALTEDEARKAALDEFPGATVVFVYLDRDDGYYEYELSLYEGALFAAYKINAETGAVLERDIRYFALEGASLSPDEAARLALDKAGRGELSSFSVDVERGRAYYEGEIRNGKDKYEFSIDAVTGTIVEWEYDD